MGTGRPWLALCFHGGGRFSCWSLLWFAQMPAVCQEVLTRGPVPETHPSFPLLICPPALSSLLPSSLNPFFDRTSQTLSGSDNFVNGFLAHGLLPCSKCLPGHLPGCAGEVERAVPEAGHMRRGWRDIRMDPVRGPVVCGAGQ